ncbi:DUF3617 domain-containing protein [Solemya velesiana gill symbiont]|uniref:DUF3617 domain-containing protein n=1 Tax=Solemya velesiana gill symbiont TaxID=1918948 RepID=A0A1T2KXI3_9GAMM|nr:DUF3617 family protein [Solemya velesiana gill symbiont]OOZ37568.1 hypothetical protein BOW51_01785 [Solemya velesiana gill symbiont]
MYKRVGLIALVLLGGCSQANEVNMNPGLWEWRSEIEMPGMPMKMPPTVYQQCITREDLVPKEGGDNQDCELSEMETTGDTVSWRMTCSGPAGQVASVGKMTYAGDSAMGEVSVDAGGMKMLSRTSGQRVGDCP